MREGEGWMREGNIQREKKSGGSEKRREESQRKYGQIEIEGDKGTKSDK